MRFTTYLRLLRDGRFRVDFLGLGMCIAIFFYSLVNSVFSLIQRLFWGRAIAQTKIEPAPVFVIGHWRSGTTMVHELLGMDENLAAPTTYECFAANHFLVSEWLFKPIISLTMPKTRPMDNMLSGVDRPQEDEFAICTLGAPSPYLSLAFPNQARRFRELIDMKGVDDSVIERFTEKLNFFCRALAYRHKRRLLLKSPTHTGRIAFLRKLFPGAKFIHVTRDPKDVIPSTIRLWNRLERTNGFQIPEINQPDLRLYVLETYRQMYDAFDEQTADNKDDIATIRYEDLVREPVENLKRAYEELDLPGFDSMESKIRNYFESTKDYQKNQHHLDEDLIAGIDEYCGDYSAKFGY